MPDRNDNNIDVRTALTLLDEIRALLLALDDEMPNLEPKNNKILASKKAEINRKLLYGAHLAAMTQLAIMNEYHRFKGERPPNIDTD